MRRRSRGERTPPAAPRQQHGRRTLRHAQSPRSIITDVAFTAAVATTPGLEAELLDRVARDRGGHEERPGLELDECHHAVDLDGAHDAAEAVAGGQAAPVGGVPSRACAEALDLARGTSRRLRASRTVLSLPSRSQRRSVSGLTPSAVAAWPIVSVALAAICLSIA